MKKNRKEMSSFASSFKRISGLFFTMTLLVGFGLTQSYAVERSGQMSMDQNQGKITVSGTVTNLQGEPIPGATIVVKGTTQGTIADIDGKYSLSNVDSNVDLLFSFVGMTTQEISVKGQSTINVVLSEQTIGLDEVVAIGYGTVKRRDITGSVASVSNERLTASPVANVAQALQGQLPGVNVISQDGRPNASISIRVRGGGSVSQSNEPLFVVDGFPVSSINDIPADQIESIDVLKDASSTAIYGARGANGVIIVTTKGAKGEKISVTYNGYLQYKQPTRYLETMNAYDYIAYNWGYAQAISQTYADAWAMLWAIGGQPKADGSANAAGIDYYKNIEAQNYQKQVYSSAYSQSHNFTIMGGDKNTKMMFALNHMDDDGLKLNSWYKRTNVSLKIDQKLGEKLTFSIDTRYTHVNEVGNENTTNGQGSILSSSYYFRPIATSDVLGVLDDMVNSSLGMYDNILQDRFNPVARIQDYTPEDVNRAIRANASLNWNAFRGFTARSEIGLNSYWNKTHTWSGAIYNNYFDSNGNQTHSGNARIDRSEGWSMRWANTLNYEFQNLNDMHDLSILAGQEMSNSSSESMYIWGNRYPVSFNAERAFGMMTQYDATFANPFGYSAEIETPNRLVSFFGRINYSLMDKYLLTATFRADGSSRFAPAHRWGYFPAAAAAWRISEEDFLKNVKAVDNLKLRLSYGSVGNDGIDASLWKMNWTDAGQLNYSINEVRQYGYQPASSTMANAMLKWETTITRNLGLDYGLFNNRIYGTIDMYWNTTKDLLMRTPISPMSGFTETFANIGSTSNKGVEIAIGGDIIRQKDFTLSANVNININRGSVDELAEGVDGRYRTQWGSSMTQPNTGDYILVEGEPVGMVRGYTYDGWYTTSDFNYDNGVYTLKSDVPDIASGIIGTVFGTTNNKPGGQVAHPGVVKFKDIAGPDGSGPDGIIDENDVSIIGNMNPKHTGGFNVNANYKGLDLALGFNWSYGNQIYNANYLAAFYGSKEDGLYRNRLNYLSNAYKIYDIVGGQITRINEPAALDALNQDAEVFLPYHENPIVSSNGIQDGSYLRLNNITLGYTLPKSISKKVGIQKARIYGTIYNALIFTSYPGLDPEVNTNTSQGSTSYPTIGLDWGAYPRARSFTFGVNIEF